MLATVEKLSTVLGQGDLDARMDAVRSLEEIESAPALEALERAARDPEAPVRFLAKRVLRRRGTAPPRAATTATASKARPAAQKRRTIRPGPISRRPSQRSEEAQPPLRVLPAPGQRSYAGADLVPMDAWELVKKTFEIYCAGAGDFVTAAALANVPFAFLTLVLVMCIAVSGTALKEVAAIVFVLTLLARIPVNFLTVLTTEAVVARLVSERYLGRSCGVRESYTHCWDRAGAIVSAHFTKTVLLALGTLAGLILLIVPGIVYGLWGVFAWSLVGVVATLEGKGWYDACRRSGEIVGYNRSRAVTFLFLMGFLMILIALPVAGVAQGFVELVASATGSAGLVLLLKGMADLALSIALVPLGIIGITLLYYDYLIRFERFSLGTAGKK